jgi:hypothetical protein
VEAVIPELQEAQGGSYLPAFENFRALEAGYNLSQFGSFRYATKVFAHSSDKALKRGRDENRTNGAGAEVSS